MERENAFMSYFSYCSHHGFFWYDYGFYEYEQSCFIWVYCLNLLKLVGNNFFTKTTLWPWDIRLLGLTCYCKLFLLFYSMAMWQDKCDGPILILFVCVICSVNMSLCTSLCLSFEALRYCLATQWSVSYLNFKHFH